MALKKSKISFAETRQFSTLFLDYINGNEVIQKFYSYPPVIESFQQAIEDKRKDSIDRKLLVEVLKGQYQTSNIPVQKDHPGGKHLTSNIDLLLKDNTFTVCTGHQLCLFTGPLYFIYKIVTTINLAKTLKKKYPAYDFVPVYWMATEDHDFEEINSIHLFGKKIKWNNPEAKGAVGKLNTNSLSLHIDELKQVLGESENAEELLELFSNAYLKHDNLADATRYLVHQLFSNDGLITIDGNNALLKKEFIEIIKDDIQNNTNYKLVNETIKELKQSGYDAQVNPREINVFRLTANDRIRIEKSESEVLNLYSEEYSPNVVLRPLYQQKILPNIAYVGGPGEIAYWLEYKAMFDHHKIMFPVLIPRNFALLNDEKSNQQLQKLGFSINDLFKDTDLLVKEFVNKNAAIELSLKEQEEKIADVYTEVSEKAMAIDLTLKATVEAELQKTLNALKNIESKLVRSEKQKQETAVNQIRKLKDKFLPEGVLQERYDNMIPYYLKSGKGFINEIKEVFDPFEFEMLVLEHHNIS